MNNFSWPVVGHQNIQQFLQKSLVNNKLAHAYLFAGPSHVGKNLVAENFLASILCHDYQVQNSMPEKSLPCGACIFCQQLAKNIHPDVYYLKKEEGKKNISIEQVREMQKFLNLSSFLNSYKIALIPEAQLLSESAQNALLKVLEEPSPKTIIIMLAPDSDLLLPTISSRCQLIKFRPLANEQIYHHLVSAGCEMHDSRAYAALACGRIGLALEYWHKPEFYSQYLEKIEQFLEFFNQDLATRFKIIERNLASQKLAAEEDTPTLTDDLEYWQLVLRDILAMQNNLDELVVNLHFLDKLKILAQRYSIPSMLKLAAEVNLLKKYFNYNVNPRLALENFMLSL